MIKPKNSIKTVIRYAFFCICFIVTSSYIINVYGQQCNKKNLTQLLIHLSDISRTKISFSPSFTNNIHPENQHISNNIEESLNILLNNSGLGFKKLKNYYYIHKLPANHNKELVAKKKQHNTSQKTQKTQQTQQTNITKINKSSSIKPDSIIIPRPIQSIIAQNKNIKYFPTKLFDVPEFKIKYTQPLSIDHKSLEGATIAIKSNILSDAMSTINIGLEVALSKRWTFDFSVDYNPWVFSDNRKMKYLLFKPEVRWWIKNRFDGHFIGANINYSIFNWGGMLPWGFNSGKTFGIITNTNILNHRYEGWSTGVGVNYGYRWKLTPRLGMEATIGMGYAYRKYDKYNCIRCGDMIESSFKHYVGPTKIGISLIYNIK